MLDPLQSSMERLRARIEPPTSACTRVLCASTESQTGTNTTCHRAATCRTSTAPRCSTTRSADQWSPLQPSSPISYPASPTRNSADALPLTTTRLRRTVAFPLTKPLMAGSKSHTGNPSVAKQIATDRTTHVATSARIHWPESRRSLVGDADRGYCSIGTASLACACAPAAVATATG